MYSLVPVYCEKGPLSQKEKEKIKDWPLHSLRDPTLSSALSESKILDSETSLHHKSPSDKDHFFIVHIFTI